MTSLIRYVLLALAVAIGITHYAPARPSHPTVEVTPDTAGARSIATSLSTYLTAFSEGDLTKAYAMFADIQQHLSLAKFEAQGDPQKGWNIRLTGIYVFEEDRAADVYAVMSVRYPKEQPKHPVAFVFPMIKQHRTWKMVFSTSDFGSLTARIFHKLNSELAADTSLPKA